VLLSPADFDLVLIFAVRRRSDSCPNYSSLSIQFILQKHHHFHIQL